MSRIKKQLEICPPAYMCKGPNRENFVSTGHKCGYCKGNGWFWGTEEGSREDVHVSCPVCGGSGELDAIITVDWKPSSKCAMRQEYYNYVVKLPVLLHELFRGKVADYHFSDMTVVMNHLVKSYIRMTDGGRVSTATRRILLCMDRIPDMSFFFRRQEKAVLFFEMDPAVADSLQRAIVSGGWGNRQRLAVRLVCAFCCGAGVTLNNLSMELASEEVFRRPEGYLIHTYVSNYQYVFLKETAAAQRMSVEGMLTAAAELLVGTDDEGSGYHIPESLGRIADRVFEVRGSTLKDFPRQCLVSIRTNTIGPDRIASFMEKHGIASAREFLRRVVLFFLEARYLIYRKEVELDEDDLPEEEETDWEETMYSQYQKRDFAISTYNY